MFSTTQKRKKNENLTEKNRKLHMYEHIHNTCIKHDETFCSFPFSIVIFNFLDIRISPARYPKYYDVCLYF